MGLFDDIGHGLSNLGKGVVHDVTHPVETITAPVSGAVEGVGAIAGLIDPKTGRAITGAAHSIEGATAGADNAIDHTVAHSAQDVETAVVHTSEKLAQGAETAFKAAVNATETEFEEVRDTIKMMIDAGEAAIAKAMAESIVGQVAGDINALISKFNDIRGEIESDLTTIEHAAFARTVTPGAREAFKRVATALAEVIAPFHSQNYVSFGVDFGASAALVLEGDASLGLLAGFPNITDIRGYGAVGVTVGAGEGVSGDVSFVFSTSAPADSGGPGLDIVIEGDFGIGGSVVVSFNLPDLSIGGISIGLSAGEEIDLSVGAGYTFVF